MAEMNLRAVSAGSRPFLVGPPRRCWWAARNHQTRAALPLRLRRQWGVSKRLLNISPVQNAAPSVALFRQP